MYYKLDGKELETINKVSALTYTDYELIGNFVPVESMYSMIEDLLDEVEHQQARYKDLEKDIEDNYKPISYAEQVGVSDRDFI